MKVRTERPRAESPSTKAFHTGSFVTPIAKAEHSPLIRHDVGDDDLVDDLEALLRGARLSVHHHRQHPVQPLSARGTLAASDNKNTKRCKTRCAATGTTAAYFWTCLSCGISSRISVRLSIACLRTDSAGSIVRSCSVFRSCEQEHQSALRRASCCQCPIERRSKLQDHYKPSFKISLIFCTNASVSKPTQTTLNT